jgi:hypothetical protein
VNLSENSLKMQHAFGQAALLTVSFSLFARWNSPRGKASSEKIKECIQQRRLTKNTLHL